MMVATLPVATPTPVIGVEMPILLSARSDLDLLATTLLPEGRPIGWSGSSDSTDPQLALLIRLDLELLVGSVMGADQRPSGWFGAVPSTPYAIARDIRHDLELLADQMVGPTASGWLGGDPIMAQPRYTDPGGFPNQAASSPFRLTPPPRPRWQVENRLVADRCSACQETGLLSQPASGSVTVNEFRCRVSGSGR
jgi:hypothetical protein